VIGKPDKMQKQQGIYIETNYAFNNAMRYVISDQTTHWEIDSTYSSQVNYDYNTPCVLEVYPDKAPGIDLKPKESFISVLSFELLMDSYDRDTLYYSTSRIHTQMIYHTGKLNQKDRSNLVALYFSLAVSCICKQFLITF